MGESASEVDGSDGGGGEGVSREAEVEREGFHFCFRCFRVFNGDAFSTNSGFPALCGAVELCSTPSSHIGSSEASEKLSPSTKTRILFEIKRLNAPAVLSFPDPPCSNQLSIQPKKPASPAGGRGGKQN